MGSHPKYANMYQCPGLAVKPVTEERWLHLQHHFPQLTFQDHINAYTRPTRCVCILPLAYASLLFSIHCNLATEMGAKLEDTMGPMSADSLTQQGQDTGLFGMRPHSNHLPLG